jgi:GT2 family glycosyltransferase
VTVLAIPFLTGQSDLDRCVASIDAQVDLLVIDNSESGLYDHTWNGFVIEMPHNLGVAASWNLAIKAYPHEPYWLIANHDTVFAPGDLDRLIAEMQRPGPRWVGINGDWRAFGINAECIETVGFFDENYVPVYCEDADYEYRCDLAGVPRYFIEGGTTHVGSASIREPRYGAANARTYPRNRDYFRRKWGGDLRGSEVFTTPFDAGGSIRDWTLDLSRLRNDWCLPDDRARHAG